MSDSIHLQDSYLQKRQKRFESQWNQIQSAWINKRMPHALLLAGSLDSDLTDFVIKLTQLILCNKKKSEPCFECADCQMAARHEHPDTEWVEPEKSGGPIKIDQIRELQHNAYVTPQRVKYRLIVIKSADRMNTASANALLKILEEPPEHTLFLLIAQQLGTVIPTVLSRCQVVRFASYDDLSIINILQLAEYYPHDSEQALILKESGYILDGLIAIIEKKEHPCVVAAQWSKFELNTLLWFLYLVYAQVQIMQISVVLMREPVICQLKNLVSLLNPIMIYTQIDKINTLRRKISHNMNINQNLALEDLLLAI